ncbi:DUF3427 domain-containing protein [Saccharibacillus alkalitolerans]|uniref:DEAD/DEAH box helicase n=1 Tax=Saccharibacillus alkalitolerans TaxID=2705290 RepID=A0ABX0F1W8_9BACL|nr:DEAD/DEAH box helicase [Saccharibacillus alkalitolerans]NGZ74978.1 DEAD/DEAH box helicase [Saccharibacillus alkalitolerans]
MDHSTRHLNESLNWGFINHEQESPERYKPKLLLNDRQNGDYILTPLLDELQHCLSFTFSVAFITESGLAVLKAHLADLHARGVSGRILTSHYLKFNHPKTFRELLKIPNIEVRLTELSGFHAKGYVFRHPGHSTIIMGSANLTAAALKTNYEWNVKLTSFENGGLLAQFHAEFDKAWQAATPLSSEWIEAYQIMYTETRKADKKLQAELPPLPENTTPYGVLSPVQPNKMQRQALRNLGALRESGARRGLVISATGTGKTYLSAFDVKSAAPRRMLFVVHREQILNQAISDYRKIIGGPDSDYGMFSGDRRDAEAKYVFATIQTISKAEHLSLFAADTFDYILIDEVHKAGAASYLNLIEHFSPKFLLGMTATPERTDTFNIYELFDYHIAYEIRLQEALEEDMLCPFHYFGVTDYRCNGELLADASALSEDDRERRVDYLTEKIEYYGHSGESVRGLIFCSRKAEAAELSAMLNARGYRTAALDGTDSPEERERRINQLEQGELQYILTVDIFNEGIDIPSINQVVMLRQTQSSIVFIQQLGRGLRKHESKEFVTVIDFIGNYQNNYLIPIALSGDKSQNKDNIRRHMKDTSYIRGLSSINFEEVARQQIFKSISESNLTAFKLLREAYLELKNRLNRIPLLMDFVENHSLDPLIFADKFPSYYHFLLRVREPVPSLSQPEQQVLTMLTGEMLNGKRRHEILLLDMLLKQGAVAKSDYLERLRADGCRVGVDTLESVMRVLSLEFFNEQARQKYGNTPLVRQDDDGNYSFHPAMAEALRRDDYFLQSVSDLIQTAFTKNEQYDNKATMTLYKKYSRKDASKLLNWDKDGTPTIFGYKIKNGTCPIFVTYKKHENIGASTKYQDEFVNAEVLQWSTRSRRTLQSEEVQLILDADREGIELHIFVKKDDSEGPEYYYLGQAHYDGKSAVESTMADENGNSIPVVHMNLVLEHAVESKLYGYLTGD